ncbi:MAG TPA: alpha/beta hydrolase [Aliidongia sp.]|nr:alpha/beta hydrolase [Aliidongia sp.]
MTVEARAIDLGSVTLHVVEAGEGPLVLLVHGWPECHRSWRHQIAALAEAGYRVVAPDLRGFGQSSCPEAIEDYTQLHMVGDMVALVAALGEERAVIVGHDWGAPIAWNSALLRPDIFHAVAGLSVPYSPRNRGPTTQVMREMGMENYYMMYFQQVGPPEAELERDIAASLRRILWSASGEMPPDHAAIPNVEAGGFLARLPDPPGLPSFVSDEDFAVLTESFKRTGFRPGLNLYRNLDRNWALLAPWHQAPIRSPSLFIAGTRDLTIRNPAGKNSLARLRDALPGLRGLHLIEGAGHWIQQERPREVNEALLTFLDGL